MFFFRFGQILFHLTCKFAVHWEKSFVSVFEVWIDHLFDSLESGKRNYCFEEKSGNSLEFWIQNLYEPWESDILKIVENIYATVTKN